MEHISNHEFLVRRCAQLSLLMYLTYDAPDKTTVKALYDAAKKEFPEIKEQDHRYCEEKTAERFGKILAADPALGELVIDCQSVRMGYDRNGLNAAVFYGCELPIIAFRGTADGEWNDNAVALIGEKYTNTYYHYGSDGIADNAFILEEYASTQQAQAFDYFRRIAEKNEWKTPDSVFVTGHSKGGNKTQFVTMRSPLVKTGFSFCGQGFSREALEHYEKEVGPEAFQARREKVYSVSANNDFVNVLGDRFVPEEQIFYVDIDEVKYIREYHECMSLLNDDGTLRAFCEHGELSELARDLWQDVRLSPDRGVISMSTMSLFEQMLGNGIPINGEIISYRSLFRGGALATGMAMKAMATMIMEVGLKKLPDKFSTGINKYVELIKPHADNLIESMTERFDKTLEKLNLRRIKEKEVEREAVHIGAEEPGFAVDTEALTQVAAKLDTLADQIQTSVEVDHRQAEIARQMQSYAQTIQEIAKDFTDVDRSLADLAGWVLKGESL